MDAAMAALGAGGLKIGKGAPAPPAKAAKPLDLTLEQLIALKLPLAQRLDYEHFAVVRTKLHWSGAFIEKK